MNIDSLIFPRFKRFKTMNLGLKRLLFILTFPAALFFFTVGLIMGVIELFGYPNKHLIALSAIAGILYPLFWILVRLIFWIYDGFKGKENEMTV